MKLYVGLAACNSVWPLTEKVDLRDTGIVLFVSLISVF